MSSIQVIPDRPSPEGSRASAQPLPPLAAPRLGSHIPALDGVRGLAILLVLFHHLVDRSAANPDRFGRALFSLANLGWCGVDLFFVLSGFLITGILLDAKGSPHYFRNFYMRRVLRIFPLYYGVLVAVFLILPLVFTHAAIAPSGQAWLWTYTSNLYPLFHHDAFDPHALLGANFGHFWSLAVEEHFYLVWPLLVFLCPRRRLPAVCFAIFALALACRIVCDARGLEPEQFAYSLTFCRADALAAGALLALLARRPSGLRELLPAARVLLGLCAAGLVALAFREHLLRDAPLTSTIGFTLTPLFFACLLLIVLTATPTSLLRRSMQSHPMTFLGRYSYGLYVYHGLLMTVFAAHLLPIPFLRIHLHSFALAVLVHFIGTASLSILLAFLSYHLFEKHFLKLKRFFDYRPRPRAGGALIDAHA